MKTILRLFVLLSLCQVGWSQAAVLSLPPGQESVATTGYLQRLDDPGAVLSPEQALRAGDWRPLPSSLSAGFTTAHVWLRVQVRPQGAGEQRWMLRLSNAVLDDVRLYRRDARGGWQEQRAGENLAREQWPVDYHSPTFALALRGGEPEVLLLRLHSKNAMSTSLDFSGGSRFAESSRREYLGFGLYFGIYLMLISFHSIFWRLTHAPGSGWYLLYVGCIVACDALTLGLPQQLLGIPVWLSDPMLGLVIALGLPVGIVFTNRHLGLSQVYPRLFAGLRRLGWWLGGAAALAVLLGYFCAVMPVLQITILLTLLILLGLAVWLLLRGHRPARFYLLAFSTYYLGVGICFLRNLGYLPASFWTDHATSIGTLLHMGVMSLRIISHYNRLKRDKARALRQSTALMQRQNARLESLVSVRTHELNEELRRRTQVEQELRVSLAREQRMREEQSDFVAMVSHEFRTPLAIIGTSAQQLARHLDAPAEKSQQRCQNIREASARLLALVDDYLTQDRMADAQPTSRFTACDLGTLLAGQVGDFPPGRIAVDYRLADGRYRCDAGLLRVAVRNLLANADRHAPPGVCVRLAVREEGELIRLSVSHPGAAIAEDERARLFHKYYRGRQAQTSAGAGLGLYMVRRIAELHGGAVELVGHGGEEDICFRLDLRLSRPLAEDETPAAALPAC